MCCCVAPVSLCPPVAPQKEPLCAQVLLHNKLFVIAYQLRFVRIFCKKV